MKVFFVKYNDPIYVKLEKLDIMIRLTNASNIAQVLGELKEYKLKLVEINKRLHLIPRLLTDTRLKWMLTLLESRFERLDVAPLRSNKRPRNACPR